MEKIRNIIRSPIVISLVSLYFILHFLLTTFYNSFRLSSFFWSMSTLLIVGMAIIGLNDEYKYIKNSAVINRKEKSTIDYSLSILIVVLATLLTYFTSYLFEVSTIFSASLICVLLAFIFNKHESEVYSGTIAGMIGLYLCSDWTIALLAGIVTGFAFIFFSPIFSGIGGKGGTIPYAATLVTVRLFVPIKPAHTQVIDKNLIIWSLLAIIMATLITYYLHYFGIVSIVKSAMLVALVFAIIIPDYLYTLTIATFAGTVLGMSSADRVNNFTHLLMISILGFLLFVPSFHILDGIGGKLGILSLTAFLATDGLNKIVKAIK